MNEDIPILPSGFCGPLPGTKFTWARKRYARKQVDYIPVTVIYVRNWARVRLECGSVRNVDPKNLKEIR